MSGVRRDHPLFAHLFFLFFLSTPSLPMQFSSPTPPLSRSSELPLLVEEREPVGLGLGGEAYRKQGASFKNNAKKVRGLRPELRAN